MTRLAPGRRPLFSWPGLALFTILAAAFAATAWAQGDPTPPPTTGAVAPELPTLLDLFLTSPIINAIIAGLSVVALLMFIFFILTVNTAAMAPSGFIDDVTKLVLADKYEEAAKVCRLHRRIFAGSIIARCLENADKDQQVLMDVVNAEGRRRADLVWNRISYLSDIANIAPMLGLLGTVLGMIRAFFLLDTESASINSKVLSTGIGQAMATTMFGLIVAILALAFYSLVKARVTKTLADIEQTVHSIVDHLSRDSSKKQGGMVIRATAPEEETE